MIESDVWKSCRTSLYSKIPKKELHLVRIENWSGVGVSDLNGCYQGSEFWVEFKLEETKVRFRKGQVPWIHRRWKAGGKIYIAVMEKATRGLYVFSGGKVQDLARENFHVVPYMVFLPQPVDWFSFLHVVSGNEVRV
jgi:hypothetical protein